MRFYFRSYGDNTIISPVDGGEVLAWLLESGIEHKDWNIGKEIKLDGAPTFVEIFDEEIASFFVLKFGHGTIPKPEMDPFYTKRAAFFRLLEQLELFVRTLYTFLTGKML